MSTSLHELLTATSEGSLAGRITFPAIVSQLVANGVESYRVDLYRREKTGYLPNGESDVVPMPTPPLTIASNTSIDGVKEAIRATQRGEITYRTFLERIADAGITHYTVYLAGRCAVYVGRTGDCHVERFPASI